MGRLVALGAAVLACVLGPGARGAVADSLAMSVAPSPAAEGTVATLSLSGNAQPDAWVAVAVNKITQPCSNDDPRSASDASNWLGGNQNIQQVPAGAFRATANLPLYPNPTLRVDPPDTIAASPGSYQFCGFLITGFSSMGADAPITATGSAPLTIRTAHDTLKIERHRQTITVRYHVEPGTYAPGRPLHIFIDACHRGQQCYGGDPHRQPKDGGWDMKVHQPDANGNGIATFTFAKSGSFAYPLRKGTLIQCWLHSAESINHYDYSDPANALATATVRLH